MTTVNTRYSAICLSVAFLLFFVGLNDVKAQPIPLGSAMPGGNISLNTTNGGTITINDLKGADATLIVFWGNRCPWIGKIEDRVMAFAAIFISEGTSMILVNSNDPEAFPKESLSGFAKARKSLADGVHYLSDGSGQLMKALNASRTPEFFLFDSEDTLVYTGSLDDSPGDASSVTKSYLADAYKSLVVSGSTEVGSTKPFGCMIKPRR